MKCTITTGVYEGLFPVDTVLHTRGGIFFGKFAS